jgi:Tol biopolymer transport system component
MKAQSSLDPFPRRGLKQKSSYATALSFAEQGKKESRERDPDHPSHAFGWLVRSTAVAMLLFCPASAAPAGSTAASGARQLSATAAGHALAPVLSDDGHTIAFLSTANNLVTNDDLGSSLDLFVRDLVAGRTSLVSVDHSGRGGGNDHSEAPTLSADGRTIAFESAASNLVLNDTNGFKDVFVRELSSGVTRLVSVASTGGAANGPSQAPLLSGDGQRVVFESAASNLVSTAADDGSQVYLRDLKAETTVRVSVDTTAAGPGDGPADSAALTADARYVVFVKRATNQVQGLESYGEVYLRDLQAGRTVWVSQDVAAALVTNGYPHYTCASPTVSADGRYVLFKVSTNALAPGLLFRRDLEAGLTVRLDPDGAVLGAPAPSADGRFVVFATPQGIHLWDEETATNHLVCANLEGPEGRNCVFPALAADGSQLAFVMTTNRMAILVAQRRDAGAPLWPSRITNGEPAVVLDAEAPLLSSNGEQVVFCSPDSRIVADDGNGALDLFVTDLSAGDTRLVSARHPDRPALTSPATTLWLSRSLSANSSQAVYLNFEAESPWLFTNRFGHLYVRDLNSGEVERIGEEFSLTLDPSFSADGRALAYFTSRIPIGSLSTVGDLYWQDLATGQRFLVLTQSVRSLSLTVDPHLMLSSDGRQLGFESSLGQVLVRDLQAGTNQLASGPQPSGAPSTAPVFSPDGRWLLFQCPRGDAAGTNVGGLFARDLQTQTTRRLSSGGQVKLVPAGRIGPVFSADSRTVAHCVAEVFDGLRVELSDLLAGTNVVVCENCDSPSVSADGRWVAYRSVLAAEPVHDVFVRDLLEGRTERISSSAADPQTGGNGHSRSPILSYDGRFVVFTSDASNLVANDSNGVTDVFVRDRLRGITFLASLNHDGSGSGNGPSSAAALAADGRALLFLSRASDLVEGDYNDTSDVFVLWLSGPDSDGDGMDDDWEMAYFNTLARDGDGDFDGDGRTDRAEYLAGTDPTNAGSVLQVMTLQSLGGRLTRVLWSAAPGHTYRVEWKEAAGNWTEAAVTVTPGGTTGSWTDDCPPSAHRFYRVRLLQ